MLRSLRLVMATAALLTAGAVAPHSPWASPAAAAEQATREIVVPARRIEAGQVVALEDLTSDSIPQRRVLPGLVVEAGDIVGMEARRTLLPGRPVLASALRTPLLVERNSEVTVIYVDGALQLSMKAKALENGSLGELVRVTNLSSGNIIHGAVVGTGRVRVSK